MPRLFVTQGEPSYRIVGPTTEPGTWRCTCPHGLDHLKPKDVAGRRPNPCKHLQRLWADASERGQINITYFQPTAAGDIAADTCRCRGEMLVLERYQPPPEVPAPPPVAGMPSRNQPCPCGWVDPQLGRQRSFKQCHGRPEGAPAGAPPWAPPGARPPPRPGRPSRAGKAREERVERLDRVDAATKRAEAADERRRAVRRLADARRKGASAETIAELEAATNEARAREAWLK